MTLIKYHLDLLHDFEVICPNWIQASFSIWKKNGFFVLNFIEIDFTTLIIFLTFIILFQYCIEKGAILLDGGNTITSTFNA